MTDIALPLRLSGAIWGHLVGDAVGVPYEFRSPGQVGTVRFGEIGTHRQPPGTWSDDGALMLALLDSLLSVDFDANDQGRRALDWYRHGAYAPGAVVFDVGTTTSAALHAIEQGAPAEEAGPSGPRSAANGSLMRILPLALWGHGHPRDELVALALRASSVTHRHPAARVACATYVLLIDSLLANARPGEALASAEKEPGDALASAEREVRTAFKEARDDELLRVAEELRGWRTTEAPTGRGGALNAFWSAWEAFSSSSSYAETIQRAVRYGNDTDTTAAIAGGLAGAYWGLDGIPKEWLAGMRGHEIVDPLLDRLIQGHGWRTSSSKPIRVDWLDLAKVPGLRDAPGRLGMTFLPGKQGEGWHGAWWRNLEADVTRLRVDDGCDLFLLLVEDHELTATRTTDLPASFARLGIELVRHPVVDMDVPSDRIAYRKTLAPLAEAVRQGRTVVVACRGGLGRTGTAVACLLVDAGLDPEEAIALTRASRRETIDRGSQVEFVNRWKA